MARLRQDATQEQLSDGREKAKARKGFVLYYDTLEAYEMLTPDQFKVVIYALSRYAKTLEEEQFEDPLTTMAYKMGVNGLNRDIESYATTCANRSAGIAAKAKDKTTPEKTTPTAKKKALF